MAIDQLMAIEDRDNIKKAVCIHYTQYNGLSNINSKPAVTYYVLS
jgi:hypothetical protein